MSGKARWGVDDIGMGSEKGMEKSVVTTPSHVIAGLVPVISIGRVQRFSDRDGRDEPGHDVADVSAREA